MTIHNLSRTAPTLPARWTAGREVLSLIAVPVLLIVLLGSFPPAVDSDVTDVASAESTLEATIRHPQGTWFGFLVVATIYLLLASARKTGPTNMPSASQSRGDAGPPE